MSRPELTLHAGFHKTGTTAIQRYAYANRRALRASGLFYPDFWPYQFAREKGHHKFVHAVAAVPDRLGPENVEKLVDRWLDTARRENAKVLLSAEPVCRHVVRGGPRDWIESRREYLLRLAEVLSGFHVRVVLVLRRQDEFIRSLYQEHVMGGRSKGGEQKFEVFRDSRRRRNLRFYENLCLFREIFPSVKILIFEDLAPAGLVDAFFRELGWTGLPEDKGRMVRQSLTVGETLVKRPMNEYVTNKLQNRLLLRWLRSWRVRRVLRKHFPGGEDLWGDLQAKRAFLAEYDAENARIVEEFLPGRGTLFPSAEVAEHSRPVRAVPDDVVGSALVAAVRSSPRKLKAFLGRDAVEKLSDAR